MDERAPIHEALKEGAPLRALRIIDCHAHYGNPFRVGNPWWAAADLLVEMDRFLDLSAMGRFYRAVDYMVQRVGSERVLFGSDGPFHSFTVELGHVVYARLSDADKERVLGLNLARLVGLAD